MPTVASPRWPSDWRTFDDRGGPSAPGHGSPRVPRRAVGRRPVPNRGEAHGCPAFRQPQAPVHRPRGGGGRRGPRARGRGAHRRRRRAGELRRHHDHHVGATTDDDDRVDHDHDHAFQGVDPDTPMYPDPTTSQRFDDPVGRRAGVRDLGWATRDPVVGEFQQGDTPVRRGRGPGLRRRARPSVVLLRQLEDDAWFVVGVSTDSIRLTTPQLGDTLTSPQPLEGRPTRSRAPCRCASTPTACRSPSARPSSPAGATGCSATSAARSSSPTTPARPTGCWCSTARAARTGRTDRGVGHPGPPVAANPAGGSTPAP